MADGQEDGCQQGMGSASLGFRVGEVAKVEMSEICVSHQSTVFLCVCPPSLTLSKQLHHSPPPQPLWLAEEQGSVVFSSQMFSSE